jgi:hypothetical protein
MTAREDTNWNERTETWEIGWRDESGHFTAVSWGYETEGEARAALAHLGQR